jgi:5-methylcytosine-specific restriction endonuclease McrA
MSLDDLEQEICELAAHIAAASCRWLLLVAEFDQREGWAEWGCISCAHWLSWRCSLAPGAARERVRVARRLGELPQVREAFGAGELSYCKVRALTRVATPETEADLVEMARHATGAQLENLLRGYRRALAATLDAADRAHAQRYLRWSWQEDGSVRIEARLPADDGALVLRAIQASEEAPADPVGATAVDPRHGETVSARRADALVTIARSAVEMNASVEGGRAQCELVVHVDAETLAADEVRSCSELAGGPALAPETVRRLGCDAALVRIIEREGRPLAVGRRTRTIPPALRRALRRRDDGCCFPGCAHRRFLHAHHIRHWAHGGSTNLDNLVQLCPYHHRLVHEGGFCVERAGGRTVRFRRPDGRPIPTVPRSRRASGPELEQQHRARGLTVNEETCRPRSAGDRIDYHLAVEVLCARALAGG